MKQHGMNRKRTSERTLVIAKCTQHEELRKFLLSTNNKKIAEANGKDSYFGIGLALTHPDVLKTASWAANIKQLGEILMEVRQELRS